jgi:hypothetical protein
MLHAISILAIEEKKHLVRIDFAFVKFENICFLKDVILLKKINNLGFEFSSNF